MSLFPLPARIAVAAMATVSLTADALAIGTGTVQAGSATITSGPTTTLITQTSNKAVINWTGSGAFDTTAGQTVQFAQPDANSITLNLIGGGPTTFNGSLLANGKVWLINPDGMLFGSGSSVNVGSLLVSTNGIANPTGDGFFTNPGSTYVFDQPGSPTARIAFDNSAVLAHGLPSVGGDIVLQAPQVTVTNGSSLGTNNSGTVYALAGQGFTADFNGDGMINFAVIDTPVGAKVPGSTSSVEVSNGSSINGRQVTVGAAVFEDAVLDHVINLGGQYEVGTYNQATNPQHVVINRPPTVYQNIVPRPPAPPVTTASAIAPPTSADAFTNTYNLTRSTASLSDESVQDTPVNPSVANVVYERPYRVDMQSSLAQGALNLLSPSAGAPAVEAQGDADEPAAQAAALGNLSPSAGGNAVDAAALGNLSPSAGGGDKAAACANNFLSNGWDNAASNQCAD